MALYNCSGLVVPRLSLCNVWLSGVQRSGDARGDCLIECPLPNSSIEQWHMVDIVTGYTLFVMSQWCHIQVCN